MSFQSADVANTSGKNNKLVLALGKAAKKAYQQPFRMERRGKVRPNKSPVLRVKKHILANKQKTNSILKNQMEL